MGQAPLTAAQGAGSTRAHGPRGSLGTLASYRARLHPQREALADQEVRLDYATLNRGINRVANGLARAGVGAGDRVGIRLANGHRYVEALFGCAKLGAVLVPVDRALVADEVDHILRDSGASLLFDGVDAFEALCEGASEQEPEWVTAIDDPLLIAYTSGTTGRPKGVVLSHGNVLFSLSNQILAWRLTAADRALVVAPFHHVGGLLVLGLPCLQGGGAIVISSPEPEAILEVVEREQVTALFLPPRLWGQLAALDSLDSAGLASVRVCASGGDPVPGAALELLLESFGAEFTDAYGLTEAASCSTVLPGEAVVRKAGSAGLPCAHNLIRILAADGSEAAADEVGEIVQAGPTVMAGYWRRPEETAIALRDGWLRTGDLGAVDDEGFLYVVGRSKDLIVSNGSKVYPAEVERVLREHPDIDEAAVIGIADRERGEAVVAVVVSRPGTTLGPAEVLEFCRDRIAGYKNPQLAVVTESLPRNANGKVLKAELRARYGPSG